MSDAAPSLTLDGPLARIRLQRPKVANRLEVSDLQTLAAHLQQVNDTPEVRVLLLEAQGRHFCSGFNIDSVPGLDAGALFASLTQAWESARPITVAAIQGGVYGGATDLALACDFRLGTPACEMFVPATRLGLHFYQGGMRRFVSRLGLEPAKRILLLGDTLDAQAMHRCGFLSELCPDTSSLHEATERLCQRLCGLAPLALLPMKQHLNALASNALDESQLLRDIAQANASRDLQEGVRAWQERRSPLFGGC